MSSLVYPVSGNHCLYRSLSLESTAPHKNTPKPLSLPIGFRRRCLPIGVAVPCLSGGMEDWAYAGSWDNAATSDGVAPVQTCAPETYGGYADDRTRCAADRLCTSAVRRAGRTGAVGRTGTASTVERQQFTTGGWRCAHTY